jgi:hypothetical protein
VLNEDKKQESINKRKRLNYLIILCITYIGSFIRKKKFSMQNRDLEETKHCYRFASPQSYDMHNSSNSKVRNRILVWLDMIPTLRPYNMQIVLHSS